MVTFNQWRSLVDGTKYSAESVPNKVVSLYEFEDDSNTSTAVDAESSNDLNITSATYDTNSKVGSLALSHDGSNDEAISQSTIDLSAAGSTDGFAVMAYIYVPSGSTTSSTKYWAGHGVDNDNLLQLINRSGNIGSFFQVGGSNSIITGPSISTGQYYHVYAEVLGDGTHNLIVDDVQEASDNSGFDPANIGSGEHRTGSRVGDGAGLAKVIVDDFALSDEPLSDSELQTMINRQN